MFLPRGYAMNVAPKSRSVSYGMRNTLTKNFFYSTLSTWPETFPRRQQSITNQNQIYRSYLGLGFNNRITPAIQQRYTSQNPPLYTPSQPEISQGRRKLYNVNHLPPSHIYIIIFGLFGLLFVTNSEAEENEEKEEETKGVVAGEVIEGLRNYTLEEVAAHTCFETGIWVTYKDGVYDITQFVHSHPGGMEKIMLAAGCAIDPYWSIFAVHKNSEIFSILESMRIGNLCPEDRGKYLQTLHGEGPYVNEPQRLPILIARSVTPFNAEPPPALLADNFLTDNSVFYVRNHLPVPVIENEADFRVEIAVEDKGISLSLDDLKKFKEHKIVATLQCSGNRRSELSSVKDVLGLSWASQAISTAEWGGVKLRDVLIAAGLDPEINTDGLHIHFEGLDEDPTGANYAASVPLNIVMNPSNDVLLAYTMNGEKIPRDHGYPLRVVVPGITGARNVKWCHRISISKEESTSHWQKKDYKLFDSNTTPQTANWENTMAMQDIPVQSAILVPAPDSVIPVDDNEIEFTLKGYAWSGGGRGISRVEISIDGVHWTSVDSLTTIPQPYGKAWAWTLWEKTISLPQNSQSATLYCRAVDTSGNSQPQTPDAIWNFRGLGNNSWHKINVFFKKQQF